MGFFGSNYTWSNNREGAAKISERLDRAWCNTKWRLKTPNATVQHLPKNLLRPSSNHGTMQHIIKKENDSQVFRVEAAWFVHQDFQDIVRKIWEENPENLEVAINMFMKGPLGGVMKSSAVFQKEKIDV